MNAYSFCQKEPSAITPEVLKKIKGEVDKEAVKFREALVKEGNNTGEYLEYSVDTFKLQQIARKRIDIDYTIWGMNKTVEEMTDGYDKLMNKYYQKLLQTLDSTDKKALIDTQREWLKFKKTEMDFVFVLLKDKYTGGGGITSNISVGYYSDIVVQRTDKLFEYYNTNIALLK